MEKTKDYKLFKPISGNRRAKESHIKALVDSIKSRNLLEFRPILVNNKMEVMDGQHRLEAAKRLGVDVYFLKQSDVSSKNLTSGDIVTLNNVQLGWALEDYVSTQIELGNKNYLKLKNICEKHKISYGFFRSLFPSFRTHDFQKSFRDGTFVFPEENEKDLSEMISMISQVCSLIRKKYAGNLRFTYSTKFTAALSGLLNIGSLDFDTLLKKIELKLDWIRPCAGKKEYFELFVRIYNYKNKIPLTREEIDIE